MRYVVAPQIKQINKKYHITYSIGNCFSIVATPLRGVFRGISPIPCAVTHGYKHTSANALRNCFPSELSI